jgi:hypothetical protein
MKYCFEKILILIIKFFNDLNITIYQALVHTVVQRVIKSRNFVVKLGAHQNNRIL